MNPQNFVSQFAVQVVRPVVPVVDFPCELGMTTGRGLRLLPDRTVSGRITRKSAFDSCWAYPIG